MKNLFWVKTKGGSMRPFLKNGKMVPIQKISWDTLKRGDVVLYGERPTGALHRLYWRNKTGGWIGDDASTLPFHWVSQDKIHGQLVGTIPQGWGGWILGILCRGTYATLRPLKQILKHTSQKRNI